MEPPVKRRSADDDDPLSARIQAIESFAEIADRMVIVGELKWATIAADYRLLAINAAMRRQGESIRATILLSRQNLGHLAVAFVRASLEDVMYLAFFVGLDKTDSQEFFVLMGNWDGLRSLLAQREYVGDEIMKQLWYPQPLLDAAVQSRDEVRAKLKELQKKYRWSGGLLPSGDWIADQTGQRKLYDYLHAATSRALHFSVGEIMRRGWGHPSGNVITDKAEFREHLAKFALDQLWRLYIQTWQVATPLLNEAGIESDESLTMKEIQPVIDRLVTLGKVPLLHAREWNLTPEGHLDVGELNVISR
jgi:hypothetical protein